MRWCGEREEKVIEHILNLEVFRIIGELWVVFFAIVFYYIVKASEDEKFLDLACQEIYNLVGSDTDDE
jgi:hypothetical protein